MGKLYVAITALYGSVSDWEDLLTWGVEVPGVLTTWLSL